MDDITPFKMKLYISSCPALFFILQGRNNIYYLIPSGGSEKKNELGLG